MSGHPDPQMLALWAGSDLDSESASCVGLHLEACPECRRTVEEIERSQEMLRWAFEDPAEADFEWVRRGVAQRLSRRRRTLRWCWSIASAVAVLMLLSLGLTRRRVPVPAAPEGAVQLPVLPALHLALEIPEWKPMPRPHPERAHDGGKAGLRTVSFVPGTGGSPQLRITTADPNVVILLPPTERTVEQ